MGNTYSDGKNWEKWSKCSPSTEFQFEPLFRDANNFIPSQIEGYDAGLQLCSKDGKACVRIYIKKNFRNWRETFNCSWVGFYKYPGKKDDQYYLYEYAVNFEKMSKDTRNFDIYEYKSKLSIASGLQIRFFKDKGYDTKLVETKPWNSG